jgi:acetyl esterase/lipase
VRLAERGIGVAAISHRLSAQDWFDPSMSKEGVKHPEHATDCARAFAWLHAHAKEHGGDPDRLYVAGHSSGGHLAALLALDEKHLKSAGLTIAAIKGAIPVGGAYDIPKYHAYLVRALGVEKADAHVTAVFGPPERWPDASPARYVKEARVPVLVITEEDEAFQAYKADFEGVVPEGSPIRFWTAADRKHDTVMVRMSQKGADVPRDRMIEFIRTGK